MPPEKPSSNLSDSPKPGKNERTKIIPIQAANQSTVPSKETPARKYAVPPKEKSIKEQPAAPAKDEKAFELNVAGAKAPNENFKKIQGTPKPKKSQAKTQGIAIPFQSAGSKNPTSRSQFWREFWNTLEWIATSALIFTAIFFVLNFQSYSTLFIDKLNQLRGKVAVDPYLQDIVNPHPTVQDEKPLPIVANQAEGKKQIPSLELKVTPADYRVIIESIQKNIPVVNVSSEAVVKRDWKALEKDIQKALQNGVVHYPSTANPGEHGNVVITGHSSYFLWDPGRYKDVFAALHRVVVGDKVVVYYGQQKYVYKVTEIKKVLPKEIEVLLPSGDDRLTLITCTPIGTNLRRLIVIAKPVKE
jgi:LPXTG-site transpeptidase (sortase) family protein